MNALLPLILACTLLTLVALAPLARALLRRPAATDGGQRRQQMVRDVFRDQLQELERNRDEGLLAASDFDLARQELQRRLLDEIAAAAEAPAGTTTPPGKLRLLVLALVLPLAATLLYLHLGTPQAAQPAQLRAAQQAQEIDAMLARLVERLKANPGDSEGWVMLARSYYALGRFAEAAEAFAHGGKEVEGNPSLLADYAESIARANGSRFNEQADALIARALKLDPEAPQALFLAGASANDRQDFATAARHWEKLLPQLEPGSEDAQALESAIAKARAASGAKRGAGERKAAPAAASIEGQVVLDGKLAGKAQADDTLYVFARAAQGSRMPLAVLRARVGDLPLTFRLDERNGLPGGPSLSSQSSVVLEARITRGGLAQTTPGDLFGTRQDVRVGSRQVRLLIDRVQP